MSKHTIKIDSITCYATSESNLTNGDEVYLMCQADGGFAVKFPFGLNESHNMKGGDPAWVLDDDGGLILNFEHEVLVTLWDHDLNDDPNLATFLVCCDFQPGEGSGTGTFTNRNGAEYAIHYIYQD